MVNESRLDIYSYIYNLLYGTVSNNVYTMNEPQELTESDVNDGFIVIRVDSVYDNSEFRSETYSQARVFVEAYVPPKSRGRLDKTKYKAFEDAITEAILDEMNEGTDEHYTILSDGILSIDDVDFTNANNAFYLYVKSFIVNID